MNSRCLIALGLLLWAGMSAASELTLSTGFEYTSGKYGSRVKSSSWYLPLIARYENGPVTLKLTVPYLQTSGEVSRTPDGVAIPGTGGSQRGLGDVVAAMACTLVEQSGFSLDGVAKLKFATADSKKGLGTGETDWSVQFDGAQRFGALTALATLGWKKYGDPDGMDFRDPVFASVGLSWRLVPATSVGFFYDWRERLRPRGAEVSELSLFATHKLGRDWKLQGYTVNGFSDASPDWGGGAVLSRTF